MSVESTNTGNGPAAEPYSKKNPFPAPVLARRMLTGPFSPKPTLHMELSLEGSGLAYEAGDALGVVARNDPRLVAELLERLPWGGDEMVTTPDGGRVPLREALTGAFDIRALHKGLLQKWQARSGSRELGLLVERDDREAYEEFCRGRELIDLVKEHPAVFEDVEAFAGVLRKLQPRLYSVASSPKAHPGQVHLTVGVVRYEARGRTRSGVCSTFLAERSDEHLPRVFVHVNKAFRLPEDGSVPVIMVGPGTGIAPFRAFLEERRVTGATGRNWLIFGNPHRATDFLYQEELEGMAEDGLLTRFDTAFSRDQAHKVYVQHRMLEAGAELWAWLQAGAVFYVCGDAERMAKDVEAALLEIAIRHGGLEAESAAAWLGALRKERRYQRDVY